MNWFLGIDDKQRGGDVIAADFEDRNGGVNHPVFRRHPAPEQHLVPRGRGLQLDHRRLAALPERPAGGDGDRARVAGERPGAPAGTTVSRTRVSARAYQANGTAGGFFAGG